MNRFIVSAAVCVAALLACQNQPAANPAAQADAPAQAAEAKPDQNYTVRIVANPAKVGEAAETVVEVKPSPGFKMNLEFPSRMKIVAPEGVKATKDVLKKDDAEVTEKVLRFKVNYTAATSGKHAMAGSADFSVCNETTCKLIRDEKLSWEVAVK